MIDLGLRICVWCDKPHSTPHAFCGYVCSWRYWLIEIANGEYQPFFDKFNTYSIEGWSKESFDELQKIRSKTK